MSATAEQLQNQDILILSKLSHLQEVFLKNNDEVRCKKVIELASKIIHHEKTIAFCGHFSAGKSSMINYLFRTNILPSSPIPTSANLVKVKSGSNNNIKVYFHNGIINYYSDTTNVENIKKYFKDGQYINKIEVELNSNQFPFGSVIMDTPGIDSTDDAHRLATESALHLADVCFYVMDYNHVLAEHNFFYTREMAKFGRPLYLIINMIDKHREEEITFNNYQQTVTDAFHRWGIYPEKVFFTSLKNLNHPLNQIEQLKTGIYNLFSVTETSHYDALLQLLIEEHLQFLEEENSDLLENAKSKIFHLSEQEKSQLATRHHTLQNKKNELTSKHLMLKRRYEVELQQIFKNAYLMPAETRELAKEFLLTRQKDFKVGVFFSSKKTEAVKQERLQLFVEKLQLSVNAELLWHVKQLLLNLLKDFHIQSTKLEKEIQQLNYPLSNTIILQTVKAGALVTGEAVLNYTNDLSENIKREFGKLVNSIIEEMIHNVQENTTTEVSEIDSQIATISEYLEAITTIEKATDEMRENEENLLTIINKSTMDDVSPLIKKIRSIIDDQNEKMVYTNEKAEMMNNADTDRRPFIVEETNNIQLVTKNYHHLMTKLEKAAEVIKDIPSFNHMADLLQKRRERLKNEQYTVALFGAFSAGKSTFVNALIGEKLLPTSPNPTTASITKMMPSDNNHEHYSGLIKFKTEQEILQDVNEVLELFQLQSDNFESLLVAVEKLLGNEQLLEKMQIHRSFLQAFSDGYHQVKQYLGKEILVSLEDFQRYVSLESLSCFVERTNLYVDNDVTEKKITIVDTPGADSINARHTDVAFEYIKNADAIIFVTYYNHAFSKADRDFLMQLGRVKDEFALDKMFFIVNASDLAHNEDDLDHVLTYVEQQLLEYGIRNPKLFPLSALSTLNKKIAGEIVDQDWIRFEEAFYQFITGDLRLTAMASAEQELLIAKERLAQLVKTVNEDSAEKERLQQQYTNEKAKLVEILNGIDGNLVEGKLKQELEELLYHLNKRILLRFSDFFKEAINPTTITGNGSELKRNLKNSSKQLLVTIGFELTQELRATTFRLEKFLEKSILDYQLSIMKEMRKVNRDVNFPIFEMEEISPLHFDNKLKNLSLELFKEALQMFTNKKNFFEKDGRSKMAEKFQQALISPVDRYLQEEGNKIINHYVNEVHKQLRIMADFLMEEVQEQYHGFESVLSNAINLEMLMEQWKEFQTLVE
ncbi:dynamin family protein [Bacillus kwashiorkori]|uniref:dynamin family protein n=1 Tax=Bacillus kwashiorkori TaxID=1522318 RepID=UPI000782BF25|nr:dynamin family protein [Bacillus kwashiorkori]